MHSEPFGPMVENSFSLTGSDSEAVLSRERLAKMSGILLKTKDWERVAKEAQFKPNKMALLCAVSERHLQRVFKKYLQCTPGQWLRELQCRLAKDLISKGYSSKAAAAELNFATDAHFCREFKKVFGASPQCFAPNHLGYLKLLVLDKSPDHTRSATSRRR